MENEALTSFCLRPQNTVPDLPEWLPGNSGMTHTKLADCSGVFRQSGSKATKLRRKSGQRTVDPHPFGFSAGAAARSSTSHFPTVPASTAKRGLCNPALLPLPSLRSSFLLSTTSPSSSQCSPVPSARPFGLAALLSLGKSSSDARLVGRSFHPTHSKPPPRYCPH